MATNHKTGYRKRHVPDSVRRHLAAKYGCPPGGAIAVPCHYCGKVAEMMWWRRMDGKPGYRVTFGGHEMDHLIPEILGGPTTAANLVLACQRCNRRKGHKF